MPSGYTTVRSRRSQSLDPRSQSLTDVEAVVNPNPRNAVNRTSSAFDGYEAMMFIFGLPWGVVNMLVCGWVLVATFSSNTKGGCSSFLLALFGIFVILPIGLVMTLLPFFGGWIVTPIVQNVSFAVRLSDCEDN